jgi:hypothetical protein
MKKFYYAIVCLSLMIAGTSMMTSCDDDTMDSIDLSGEWEGDMGMFIDYGGYRFNAHNTWISFHPDYEWATHGWGEEVDYFTSDAPYYCQNLRFNWEIKNQVLYLTYKHNHNLDIAIYDYHFGHKRTTLDFTINNKYQCHLNKLVDYQDNWYWWDHDRNIMENQNEYYHYMTWADYNLAKSRDGKVEKSVEIKPENISMGRDFSKFEQVNP